ncbi:MAG TPA: DUF423 domain-containing protein [Xanthobacteraceae bacterium]
MTLAVFVALAGLMGAGGVILAAAGAHDGAHAGVESAAYMLLFHAAAVLGGAALTQQGLFWRPVMLAVLGAWVAGAALFSGAVAVRAFAGHRLFPMAAPSGGTLLIVAWLMLVGVAVCALIRRGG